MVLPEDVPPQQPLELVVPVPGLEEGHVGCCVVGDPQPVGEGVGYHHVDGVVAAGEQQEDDAAHAGQQRQPVQRVTPGRGVCNNTQLSTSEE